jgi:arginyl-tRNA synthetase
VLAKELKQSPMQIAQNLAIVLREWIWESGIFEIVATGPYVNFMMNRSALGSTLIQQIQQEQYFYWKWEAKGELILVESPGPNTNKPLHLGHVRNLLLGNSVADILEFAGYNVKKVDIVNDRGVHICKSMLAYQKLGNGVQPNKKSDHYVWDRYVAYDAWLADHPERESEIKEMLIARENGDKEVRNLWKQMNKWCLDGHQTTYMRYGTVIDKTYLESDHYLAGKQLVMDGLEQWLFRRNDKGNVVADLSASGGAEKVLLRSDDTSIYITQDLALGQIRYQDYHMDRMIYVVGSEQDEHFKSLFQLFNLLGYSFANKCYHLSYGMISLPDGKMKSRTGNVVDADNLADDMYIKCTELLVERHADLDHTEVARRAEIIAMAAIKLFILKYDAKKNFVFDKENSLAFDGETGPYVLYTYARAKTILNKSDIGSKWVQNGFKISNQLDQGITQDERVLLW